MTDPTTPKKRRYFQGPLMQAPREWKLACLAAMERRGINKSDLADAIGAEKSAITRLFSEKEPVAKVSRMVEAISKFLDVPLPVIGVDVDASDIIEMVGQLDDNDKARVIDFVRRLSKDD